MYRFDAEVWLSDGEVGWHFITVPPDVSDDIEERTAEHRRGFGSARVRVTIGSTTWTTSVFPDTKRQAYVLPVKKQVRSAEGFAAGDTISVELSLVDV